MLGTEINTILMILTQVEEVNIRVDSKLKMRLDIREVIKSKKKSHQSGGDEL